MREKKTKKFLVLALVTLVLVTAVFSAAMLLKKGDAGSNSNNVAADEVAKIIESKEALLAARENSKLVDFNKNVQEVSEALDKINENDLKTDEAKAKLNEAKESFAKIKTSGELAGLISKLSSDDGISSETIDELKQNEQLKTVAEAMSEYKSKLEDFKTKYAGTGEDIQAVLDYSALEAQAESVKVKLQETELTEVTSDEIETFYGKIEELKEIISK